MRTQWHGLHGHHPCAEPAEPSDPVADVSADIEREVPRTDEPAVEAIHGGFSLGVPVVEVQRPT